jgi:hypothetical protein
MDVVGIGRLGDEPSDEADVREFSLTVSEKRNGGLGDLCPLH